MYAVVEEVYTFYDRSVDGMDHDFRFVVKHMNGTEIGVYLWRETAEKIAELLNKGRK